MPFFIPVDFASALPINTGGNLSKDQHEAIALALRARKVTAYILIICELFQLLIAAPAFLFSEWGPEQKVLQAGIGVYVLATLAIFIWGIVMLRAVATAKAMVATAKVFSVTGTPTKYNYSTTYQSRYGGATHIATVKAGWLNIKGEGYGVLPGELYTNIPSDTSSTFYFIKIPMTGFKKYMVVNFF